MTLASEVTIKSGWPVFKEIVVTDDGHGMSADEFEHLVKNIGLSSKTAGHSFRIPALGITRVTIGHYGIGLLAVGQLASTMTIRSKKSGTREGFRAELDFEQFEVKQDAGVVRSHILDEEKIEEKEHSRKISASRVLSIGTCKFWPESYPSSAARQSFTKIQLTKLRAQTVAKLSGTLRDKQNPQAVLWQEYSSTYADLLRLLREREGFAKQGIYPYEQLVWELGVYCPVAYSPVGEFAKHGELAQIAEIARSTCFSLKMDGMEVLKPFEDQFFQDDCYKYSHVFKWLNEPYTGDKKGPIVSGYLIFKPQIRPKAIQGILVRESGVAVGMYDATYLQYPYNEGQKFNQLTGELYATGLSGALNIDRNNFNETDDRYLQRSDWLHSQLRTKVFPEIKRIKAPLRQNVAKRTKRFSNGRSAKWQSPSTSGSLCSSGRSARTSHSFRLIEMRWWSIPIILMARGAARGRESPAGRGCCSCGLP